MTKQLTTLQCYQHIKDGHQFFAGIHFQVRTICTQEKGVNELKKESNSLWSSWKVAWSKPVSAIRAWSSPDSNKVTNDGSFRDCRVAWGIWQSWHFFPSSSSIVLKGVLCSFFKLLQEELIQSKSHGDFFKIIYVMIIFCAVGGWNHHHHRTTYRHNCTIGLHYSVKSKKLRVIKKQWFFGGFLH